MKVWIRTSPSVRAIAWAAVLIATTGDTIALLAQSNRQIEIKLQRPALGAGPTTRTDVVSVSKDQERQFIARTIIDAFAAVGIGFSAASTSLEQVLADNRQHETTICELPAGCSLPTALVQQHVLGRVPRGYIYGVKYLFSYRLQSRPDHQLLTYNLVAEVWYRGAVGKWRRASIADADRRALLDPVLVVLKNNLGDNRVTIR